MRRFEKKFPPPPILWEPLKAKAPPRTAVGHLKKKIANGQRRTQPCRQPFIHYIQLLATAVWTNLQSVFNGVINILSPECCFLCRLRRYECLVKLVTAQWMLRNVGNCTRRPVRTHQLLKKPTANGNKYSSAWLIMALKHVWCCDKRSVICPELEITSFQDVPEISDGDNGGEKFRAKRWVFRLCKL